MTLACMMCGKTTEGGRNYCDWDCQVAHAKSLGGEVHSPNGLPIRSIRFDNSMWEHEHADHPDYIVPVTAEFIGIPPAVPEWDDSCGEQTHALIYTDGCVALTMWEACYAMWHVNEFGKGMIMGGSLWSKYWRLDVEKMHRDLEAKKEREKNR